jgi:osmotically-inducible protein OsmY
MEYAKSHGRKVAELMSEKVITAIDSTPISELSRSWSATDQAPADREG